MYHSSNTDFFSFHANALKVLIKSYSWVSNLKLFTFLKKISTQHNRVNKLKCHRPRDILINVIGHKGIGVAFFSLSVSSGLLRFVLTSPSLLCSSLFGVVPFFKNDNSRNVLISKFTKNNFISNFVTKWEKCYNKVG